jgi:hypothetical protein
MGAAIGFSFETKTEKTRKLNAKLAESAKANGDSAKNERRPRANVSRISGDETFERTAETASAPRKSNSVDFFRRDAA